MKDHAALPSYGAYLAEVRKQRPLVHHISNRVTLHAVANATLAVGASPVMTDHAEEIEEISGKAGALVLNLGTPGAKTLEVMIRAGQAAHRAGVPIVFDPVGVAATSYRWNSAHRILSELRLTSIRGNRSEICALAGFPEHTPGIDTNELSLAAARRAAQEVAAKWNVIVAATGSVDVVASPGMDQLAETAAGHPLLTRISGTGCMLSAVIAAFLAAATPRALKDQASECANGMPICHKAVIAALGYFGHAAARAAAVAKGPGSFQAALLDHLHAFMPDDLDREMRVAWTSAAKPSVHPGEGEFV